MKTILTLALALPLAAQQMVLFCDQDIGTCVPGKMDADVEWSAAERRIKRKTVPVIPVPPVGVTIHRPRTAVEFQAVIDRSAGGDEIRLAAGLTYTGNIRLPGKASVVTIRTDDLSWSTLGVRVGPADAPRMARIQTPNSQPAIQFLPGADNWSIVGVHIQASPAARTYNVVQMGDIDHATTLDDYPDNVTIDMCYIRGDPVLGARRGVLAAGTRVKITNSYLSDFFETGADSQAILIAEGQGPTLVENNFIEGAGENLFISSATPGVRGQFPENITIRRNHIKKRLAWSASPGGINVKNLFEIKSARHVLIEGNVLENNWVAAQNGFGILFTCRDENGDGACEIVDVVFRNNKIINTAHGINVLGKDDMVGNVGRIAGLRIENNLLVGAVGRAFQFINGVEDVTVSQNTVAGTANVGWLTDMQRNGRIVFTNNVLGRGEYGLMHSGTAEGTPSIVAGWREPDVRGNVLFPPPCCGYTYPPGNTFVANAAAVPAGVGVDMAALNAAIAGVVR